MSSQPEWFKDWFNSSYYHYLYQHRNEDEAAAFITNLISFLNLQPQQLVWDLACGKGRHAKFMASKNLFVIGTDLAENSIYEAQQQVCDHLEFYVHDMRRPFRSNYFDAVTNLFTSIGYFKNDNDNVKVFQNVYHALKPGGLLVVDFFNAAWVKSIMVPEATVERPNMTFHIRKRIEDKAIIKNIQFEEEGKHFVFEERVSLLDTTDFDRYATLAGLKRIHTFGDYALNAFDSKTSERLILVFQK
jgi:SAM-dependent methyltransferase